MGRRGGEGAFLPSLPSFLSFPFLPSFPFLSFPFLSFPSFLFSFYSTIPLFLLSTIPSFPSFLSIFRRYLGEAADFRGLVLGDDLEGGERQDI
jgi:hypothetical protein